LQTFLAQDKNLIIFSLSGDFIEELSGHSAENAVDATAQSLITGHGNYQVLLGER
jgi:hypothetical protein